MVTRYLGPYDNGVVTFVNAKLIYNIIKKIIKTVRFTFPKATLYMN